ncbi:MAG: alanyl-tRNA synthetase [Marivirga sp.]|jgi:alanyl-tRNA synthetase
MTSSEIRKKFLDFFVDKNHKVVPSAPMVLKNDPTLMFTNAGMNQFKDYFLGNQEPSSSRVADTQKCLRVSGKHNDLEEVGHDTYHHTMFEMLGNWSFGDYFKRDAINWAWELLTDVYKLPKDRLYVTVFEGDKGDKLAFDQEAFDLWKQHVAPEKILNGNKKDNFWEMGETGPCGPCSEIHVDLRSDLEIAKVSGAELVNQDHPLVIEIWNLVFMQFNRMADGKLTSLPAQHVDTGMGFERLCMAIQGKTSNYDTDAFTPLIKTVEDISGKFYGQTDKVDIAFRVIVDHIRAISLSIADGQLPSNNKAGYVIRRILRRAVRYGYTFLDLKEPFLFQLVATLSDQFALVFPELKAQQVLVERVIKEEEQTFLRTLEKGLKRIEILKEELAAASESIISGKIAFELFDTYGFPVDLTALIAKENNLKLDEVGFEAAMAEQKTRSKSAAKMETGDWQIVTEGQEVTFIGYDTLEAESSILRYRKVKNKNREQIQIVLNKTPFYAESGGQIGDTGLLQLGEEQLRVLDTKKENDLIVHFVDKLPKDLKATVVAKVDATRRNKIVYNHSATHLLHAALRHVLGVHVQQKGSLVSEKLLRFDFSHFSKMTDEEVLKVQQIVNAKIRENIQKTVDIDVPIEEAKQKGAMALFGEKYGDAVRVITFDPNYSVELCGGVHVAATGDIGLFKIITESSVASGIRRIEAITADTAEHYYNEQEQTVKELAELLKNPKDLKQAVEQLIAEKAALQKAIDKEHAQKSGLLKEQLIEKVTQVNGVSVLVEQITMPSADALKKLSFELKNEIKALFAVLACDIDGKPQISVVIDETIVAEKSLNAGQIIRDLAKNIQGGGGGQPFFAIAGGKDIAGLAAVIEQAKQLVKEKL